MPKLPKRIGHCARRGPSPNEISVPFHVLTVLSNPQNHILHTTLFGLPPLGFHLSLSPHRRRRRIKNLEIDFSPMSDPSAAVTGDGVDEDSSDLDQLYEFGERLNEAKDKSQNVEDYKGVIRAAKGSIKAKQLAAQLIPRFFKFFPELSDEAVYAHLDLCEEEELGVRVQAIRGLPLFCKDNPEYVAKIVDILAQLLMADENVERDAVQKALMSLLRQDVGESLSALFKHVSSQASVDEGPEDTIRDMVLAFIKDKVFPLKAELLKPQEQMERHITDLIKKSLQDVTSEEFKMFMQFLKSLSIFGDKAPAKHIQELVKITEEQADLDAQFNVSDIEHIERFLTCISLAIPFFMRGGSNSNFLTYVAKHILPVFDKLPEERKLELLKNLAETSPYTTPQDSRQFLPLIVQLLKKHMPARKTEEMNFSYVECLLYTFHHLASKAPNATNSLCGFKVVTGQPSDRLGEDFSDLYKEFMERLTCVEELTRATMKKLTQGMDGHNKAMAIAKSDEEKLKIKTEKHNATIGLRTCNNILAMTQPLHAKSPSFIGDKRINLSWKDATRSSATSDGGKRSSSATNGSNSAAAKRGRGAGDVQNQLINRALEGVAYGGVRGGRGRGKGWGGGDRGRGRGRGRGYW